MALIGIFFTVFVSLDRYGRGKLDFVRNQDGAVNKVKTISVLVSSLFFSAITAVLVAYGFKFMYPRFPEPVYWLVAGLAAVAGRDIFYTLAGVVQGFVKDKANAIKKPTGKK